MSNNSFTPRWLSPPGSTIKELIERKGITLEQFAREIEISKDNARYLLRGDLAIDATLSTALARTLGSTPAFWTRREELYRQEIHRLLEPGDSWLAELPLADMVKLGWIPQTFSLIDKISACLDFFDVSDVASYHERYAGTLERVAFKTSNSFDSDPGAVTAWIRQAEILASNLECAEWNKVLFLDVLQTVRELTRWKSPSEFIPELQRRSAAAGVAVVVARAPTGCRASGATKFGPNGNPIILLSFRHLSEDHFWFAFFHEAGHVILHGPDSIFVEGVGTINTPSEGEANTFAEDALVPTEYRSELFSMNLSKLAVARFARKIGVSAGIVIGQLQHHGVIPHSRMNFLKRRFRWSS